MMPTAMITICKYYIKQQ